ncbi:MAG TPA: M48 family metalloprotease [Xanthobacteraceae bacterium]|nr:M48 family metalloprotease [Xanthobacteraceae bacterium]
MDQRTPSRARRAAPASRAIAALTACALVMSQQPVAAQAPANAGLPIIRDSEIEQLMRDYSAPILKVAGLAQQNVDVVLINSRVFNAFVMDGHHIFINVGALYDAKTPNEIIGVLAHETGHMAGGHLARLREQLASAQTAAIIGMLLGVGAVAAGAAARSNNTATVGAAALQAPQEMIMRSLLAYQRAQEESADRAGVKFLNATQQSAKGMYVTFKRFADDMLVIASRVDPYLQTHPMPRERMAALEELIKTNPYWDKKDPPELQLRHDMMRAKLAGFLEQPDAVLRRYPSTDTSLPARYARAIAAYRFGNTAVSAQTQIDALIQAQPNNPYFYELKGQALLESGRPAEAIAPLRRAVALAPTAPLIKIMLGQALVATGDNRYSDEAISLLKIAMAREPDSADLYAELAMAYGRKGSLADADLASAQAALARGDVKTARELAARAKTRFPTGSPGWVKADDIVELKPPKKPLFSTNVTFGPAQRGPSMQPGPNQ